MFLIKVDLLTGLAAICTIGITLLLSEWAVKERKISPANGRKLLHIIAIGTCAWAIYRFENTKLLAGTFFFFFGVLLWVIHKGWLQVSQTKSYGIAFFPLAFGILLLVPVLPRELTIFAVLTLGICDAAAGLAGERWGKQKIVFLSESKSWTGFAAFFISLFLLTLFYFKLYSAEGLLVCAIVALLPALTELFSYKGSDNLTVPLATAAWVGLLHKIDSEAWPVFGLLILLFFLLCFFATAKKWLTISGATAALWMALFLYACGGAKAFIAPGLFLISGSLLSKLNRHDKEKNGRNAIQVFANGMVGIGCFILYNINGNPLFLTGAFVSFAISMSDSVSSETGLFFKGRTVDITGLKKMAPGVSGGISLAGTLGGLLAAVVMAAAVDFAYQLSFALCSKIAALGFAGMLADSLLGSRLQAKYQSSTGLLSDDAAPGSILVKGYSWCTNDVVNVMANAVVTGLYLLVAL
jgi:uncharacterized protein (TIGR00297 family)